MITSLDITSAGGRHAWAADAMRGAAAVRQACSLTQHSAICIYDVCQALGVSVRFNDIDMEGMYQKGTRAIIHLSSMRPLARRAYNCAHELGHHYFGHGSVIHELRDRSVVPSWQDPDEFLADTFAAHLLMPTIGIRGAFNKRNLDVETASPEQLYVIACDFGVGYQTLITHLSVGLGIMSQSRASSVKKQSPKSIRQTLLGRDLSSPLIVAGKNRSNPNIDAEVSTKILLPKDVFVEAGRLKPLGPVKNGSLFEAQSPGPAKVIAPNWSATVRVSHKNFVGLARFRHLEDAA